MILLLNLIRNTLNKLPPIKTFSTTKTTSQSSQSSIQVSLFGGHTTLGKMTSLLLKQNPLITALRVQGRQDVNRTVNDLDIIDTDCRIEAFSGQTEDIIKTIRGVDIVLILKENESEENTPLINRVMMESPRIYDIAKQCTLHAPRAIIIVAVPPVSVFTAMVTDIFKDSNFYQPKRILGSAAMAQIKLNTMMGRYQNLNPYICHVPIVGGPDMDLAVPLFSKAKPVELHDNIAECLLARFRQVKDKEFPTVHCRRDFIENHDLSEASALNNMISVICFGLLGDKAAFCNAFMRSNMVPSCQHLVTTVQFGPRGVLQNCGLPELTKFELEMFEKATTEIRNREQIAREVKDTIELKYDVPPFVIREQNKKKKYEREIKNEQTTKTV